MTPSEVTYLNHFTDIELDVCIFKQALLRFLLSKHMIKLERLVSRLLQLVLS